MTITCIGAVWILWYEYFVGFVKGKSILVIDTVLYEMYTALHCRDDGKFIVSLIFFYHLIDAPENGEVRLYWSPVNPSFFLGRVNVYMSDVWGKVKGLWTSTNAKVVCRQLGYDLNSKYVGIFLTHNNYASSLSYMFCLPVLFTLDSSQSNDNMLCS